MIRAFEPSDLERLKELHEKHFKYEFLLPDFMQFICAFVVEDDKGVLTIGGVRDIAECIAITDMDRLPQDRIKALYQLLDASTFVCKQSDYDQMFVWSQNEKYSKRLMRNGFRLPRGKSLILDL
jgi:hypothetical protein